MEPLRKRQSGNRERKQPMVREEKDFYSPASLLAHDTRNWLTVLQVYCDLLQTCSVEDARYQSWIHELATAVGRGQGLVASFLDTVHNLEPVKTQTAPRNRPTSFGSHKFVGQAPANVTNLASAIACRLPMIRKLAGDKVQVNFEIETETTEANLAEGVFDRILHNLAVNAIEAMPHGGELRIALSCFHVEGSGGREQSSNMVLLRLSDTGVGISPSLLPLIFQPGVSGKKLAANNPAQRGLGLAVVRDLTVRAGGSVRVSSRGAHGAIFEIELPATAHGRPARAPFSSPATLARYESPSPNQQPADSLLNPKQIRDSRPGRVMDRGGQQANRQATKLAVRKRA
jgi:signal transduction histidine kinase